MEGGQESCNLKKRKGRQTTLTSQYIPTKNKRAAKRTRRKAVKLRKTRAKKVRPLIRPRVQREDQFRKWKERVKDTEKANR